MFDLLTLTGKKRCGETAAELFMLVKIHMSESCYLIA